MMGNYKIKTSFVKTNKTGNNFKIFISNVEENFCNTMLFRSHTGNTFNLYYTAALHI